MAGVSVVIIGHINVVTGVSVVDASVIGVSTVRAVTVIVVVLYAGHPSVRSDSLQMNLTSRSMGQSQCAVIL